MFASSYKAPGADVPDLSPSYEPLNILDMNNCVCYSTGTVQFIMTHEEDTQTENCFSKSDLVLIMRFRFDELSLNRPGVLNNRIDPAINYYIRTCSSLNLHEET